MSEVAEYKIMYELTTRQIRALASQQNMDGWDTADIANLKRKLLVCEPVLELLEQDE